jgi:protein phosphatase
LVCTNPFNNEETGKTNEAIYLMSTESFTESLVENAKVSNGEEFLELIKHVIFLLKKEQKNPQVLRVEGRLAYLPAIGNATIIGDLHGDLQSLSHILKQSKFIKKSEEGEDNRLIFLGDYGDRGAASPETYFVILKLKERFFDKVILIRGNHEGPVDMKPVPHELPDQLKRRYGETAGIQIYAEMRKLFDLLYSAVIIDKMAVLIHGGLPSESQSIKDLAYAFRKNPVKHYLEEMLWSDPKEELTGTEPSPRGAGKLFGSDVTERLLKLLNVQVLIRGHESCPEGFKINHNGKVLTLFSTNKPPYKNKYVAYLQLDLSKSVINGKQLEKQIKQF